MPLTIERSAGVLVYRIPPRKKDPEFLLLDYGRYWDFPKGHIEKGEDELAAALRGGFIWDDDDYVTNNPNLRSLSGLSDIWLSPRASPQYYPLVHTSFWIEQHLWGLHAPGYHIVNVLLHATAAILLWRVVVLLELPGAFLAACLFAVHPINVESVAWITERKNVLSAVFYFASALGYLRWEQRSRQRHL